MTESQLVDKIRLALKKRGAKTLKMHGSGYQEAGTPDIIGCYRGMFFAFEVKLPGKVPTELQKKRLGEWYKAGPAAVSWGSSVERAMELLDAIDRLLPPKP